MGSLLKHAGKFAKNYVGKQIYQKELWNFSDSVSTAYVHLSSVAYYYRLNGRPSLTESATIKMYMKGLKRKHINTPVNRALAMSKEILSAMRKLLRAGPPNLVLWRTVWRAHVEFALMLRHDDVKRLTRNELSFEENATGKFIRMKLIGKTNDDHSKECLN